MRPRHPLLALCALIAIGLLLATLALDDRVLAANASPTVTERASLDETYQGIVPDSLPHAGNRHRVWQESLDYQCDDVLQRVIDQVVGTLTPDFSLPARIIAANGPPGPDAPAGAVFWTIPVRDADAECDASRLIAPQGKPQACMIVLLPDGESLLTNYLSNSDTGGGLNLEVASNFFRLLAHELYHCHQYYVLDDVANFPAAPRWIAEGTAEWVGMHYAYGSTGVAAPGESFWSTYLNGLGWDLFNRNYDAVGFFAHLHLQIARNGMEEQRFWAALDGMIRLPWLETNGDAAERDELNAQAFTLAVELGGEDFLALWAMKTIREPGWGDDNAWWLIGPGLGDDQRPPPPDVYVIVPGALVEVGADPRAIVHANIWFEPGASVLQVDVSGYGALHWHEEDRDDRFEGSQSYQYCMDPAGCTCPDGSNPLGSDARQLAPDSTATIALTGGLDTGLARFTLLDLADTCTADASLVCPLGDQATASGARRAWQEADACSCDSFWPGSTGFAADWGGGDWTIDCFPPPGVSSDFGMTITIGPFASELWAVAADDGACMDIGGGEGCLIPSPYLIQVWIPARPDVLVWVWVDGDQDDVAMALAIARYAVDAIRGG